MSASTIASFVLFLPKLLGHPKGVSQWGEAARSDGARSRSHIVRLVRRGNAVGLVWLGNFGCSLQGHSTTDKLAPDKLDTVTRDFRATRLFTAA